MLELDRSLVEHCLPIRPKFHHFQQPRRWMLNEVELEIKEEIEKLLKAKFIRPIRYVQVVRKYCSYDEEKWKISGMCGF